MQKKALILLSLVNLANFNLEADNSSTELITEEWDNGVVHRNQPTTPAFQYPIKPSDLNHHATASNGMYTINRSGRYYLSQDLMPSPSNTGVYTVRISACNVTLDLNGKTITRNPDNHAGTNLTAIQIDTGMFNIRIANGYVQGKNNNNQYIGTGINIAADCKLVTVHNVQINQCNVAGIVAASTNNLTLESCTANECTGSAALNGLSLSSCNDVIIKNSNFNLNTTSSGAAIGANFSSCTNVNLDNCQASNTSTTSGSGTTAYGFQFSNCSDCVIKNCKATNTAAITTGIGMLVSSCSDCHFSNLDVSITSGTTALGISVASSQSCSFDDCLVNRNTASSGAAVGIRLASSPVNSFTNCTTNYHSATSGEAIGFDIQSGSNNCILKNCTLSYNTAASSTYAAYGAKVAAQNVEFNDCHANRNNASHATGSNAYGFYFSSSDQNRMDNCRANNNISAGANAYGVYLSNCANNLILNTQAIGNNAQTDNLEAVGFYSTGGDANRFESCIANGQLCDGSTGGSSQLAAGFKFQSSETRSQILSCEAIGNNGGGGASSHAYGVFFSGSSAASSCIIRNTIMAHNIVSAGRNYGFYDASTAVSTTLIGNTSIGHGQCLVSATLNASNQFIDTANTGMNYYYNHAGTGDDPRNVIAEAPRYNINSISTSVGGWENISLY
jgi:hypothetical protein